MKQYLELAEAVKTKGTYKAPAREGMPGTTSLFGYQFRHDLSEGFPLLTTKKLSFKNIVTELLWFLRGDTNIKYLVDKDCNIWNEDQQNFVNKNNWTKEGSLGYQYPWLWRSWGKEDRNWQPKPNFKREIFSHQLFPPIIRKSKSKFVGQTIKTKEGYEYLIYDYNSSTNVYYLWFIHDGVELEKKNSSGFENVKYPYHKTSLGIACIGKPEVNPILHKKLYSIWRGMINRCYDPNNISYHLYGGKGVYVDNSWLCFEYFVKDIKNIKNWDKKLDNWSKYTLEKDFGRGFIYSKKDCIWSEYNFSRLDRVIYYTFKNKETDEVFTTNNFADFGRKIGKEKLVNSHMKKLIDGRLMSLAGWSLIEVKDKSFEGIDQIKELIEGLKNNPMGRRHIISAWNPTTLNDMALNACHALVQFNCRPLSYKERLQYFDKNFFTIKSGQPTSEDLDINKVPKYKLDCQMYQRSADLFLGVPYNIASYGLLTHILCKICNMVVGDFIHTFGDVHIYDNHMDQINEQLTREPKELPELVIAEDIVDGFKKDGLDRTLEWIASSDFKLKGYDPHPAIIGKLSTGLKK